MPKQINESVYLQHLTRSRNTGNYFLFFRPYLKIMPRMTALFVQDLINLASMPGTKKQTIDDKEYFWCTGEFLAASACAWTEEEQRYHLNILKEKDYADTKRMGMPSTRWVFLNLAKMEDDLDKDTKTTAPPVPGKNPEQVPENTENKFRGKTRNKSRGKPPINKVTNVTINNKKGRLPANDKSKGCLLPMEDLHPANEFINKCSSKLYAAVFKYTKETPHKELRKLPNPDLGPKEFARLLDIEAQDKVERVLDWFVAHIGGPGVPEIFCGHSFRLKFDKIVDAINREAKPKFRETLNSKDGKGGRRFREDDGGWLPEESIW